MAEVLDDKFFIRSNDEGFTNRQADVFAKLSALEDGHTLAVTSWKSDDLTNEGKRKLEALEEEDGGDDDDDTDDERKVIKTTKSGESFKVPIGIPPKRASRGHSNSLPDYSIHPEKWTRYTLSDVNEECMSESANSAAAVDFLTSRWKTCSDYEEQSSSEAADDIKISDSCASTSSKSRNSEVTDIKFSKSSSEISSRRWKRNEETNTEPSNVKLSHVIEEHDDDEDESDLPKTSVVAEKLSPCSEFRSVRKRQRNIRSIEHDVVNDD